MAGWKYAELNEAENGGAGAGAHTSTAGHRTKRIRACLNSKALWRSLLVLAIVLLSANLFFPARDELRRHGYLLEQEKANEAIVEDAPQPATTEVDWSRYAYCQYVTNEQYLCNSVMIFEALSRLGARADKLMMHPSHWSPDDNSEAGKLLKKVRDEYGVRLQPIIIQHFNGEDTWADSFTKLLAFNQTAYARVLSLDSDATVLQPMDELFLIPSAPVAMPRAYWLDDTLSSQLVLIEPSAHEFRRIQEAFQHRTKNDFDMEIVNQLYGKDCFVLPHRKYDLLSGEFRSGAHTRYLGDPKEKWDPDAVFNEAKFMHFSDWPYPKPWVRVSAESTKQLQPKCNEKENGEIDCRNREIWLGIYDNFRKRRKDVCGNAFRWDRRRDVESIVRPPSKYEPIF